MTIVLMDQLRKGELSGSIVLILKILIEKILQNYISINFLFMLTSLSQVNINILSLMKIV